MKHKREGNINREKKRKTRKRRNSYDGSKTYILDGLSWALL
jgi:hypothetical protein